jgi:transcriptional regulator with XRE-family HTH domain
MEDSMNENNPIELKTSGEKMQFIRKHILRLSLEAVAKKLGYSDKSSISKIEKNNATASNMRHFYMFCGAYNIPSEIFEKKEINSSREITNILEKHKSKTEGFTRDKFLDTYIGKWYLYLYTNIPNKAGNQIMFATYTINFSKQHGYIVQSIDEYDKNTTSPNKEFEYKGTLKINGLQVTMKNSAVYHNEEVNITWKHCDYIELNKIVFAVLTAYTMRGYIFATKCIFSTTKISFKEAERYLKQKELIEMNDKYISSIN